MPASYDGLALCEAAQSPWLRGPAAHQELPGDENHPGRGAHVLHGAADVVQIYDLRVNSHIVDPVPFNRFVMAAREYSVYWLLLNRPPAGGA
jgi:hypothetical protein